MKSYTAQLQELLDRGVLTKKKEEEKEIYCYNEVPLLYKDYSWRPLECFTSRASLEIQAECLVSVIHINDRARALLDTLWAKHCLNQRLVFKNGSVRRSFIKETVERLSSERKRFPATKELAQKISANWERIPEEIRQDLSWTFDFSTGECVVFFSTLGIITKEGRRETRRVSSELYREAHSFFGECWVLKTSPKQISECLLNENEAVLLSEEEYKFLRRCYVQCSSCKTWHNKEDLILGLCRVCAGDYPTALVGYSTRAHEIFDAFVGKSKYSSTLLGVELEYEFGGDQQEVLYLLHKHLKNHAIFKRDGSLTNGVEICTRPASIDIHLECFKKAFDDPLLMERLEVQSTCGMHVHIDRRKMSALSLGKLIQFIQNQENKTFLETVAGRLTNRYAKLSTDLSVTSFQRGLASSDRYLGINTQNQNTAEIRIFKTPITYSKFAENLEFVSALNEFVQPANSGIKDLSTKGFLKFVKENRGIYKEFYKFTKETTPC